MGASLIMSGGIGCDVVTGTDEYTARTGRIAAAVVREDGTTIASIKVGTTETTDLSYQGATELVAGEYILFDTPITKLTLGAGSVTVYYI